MLHLLTPEWLKPKKATINPQNVNNVYCFMNAATIALYHCELGKNPGCISEKSNILEHEFNWHFSGFYKDYTTFYRFNSDVEEENVCPEYISDRNFDKKKEEYC